MELLADERFAADRRDEISGPMGRTLRYGDSGAGRKLERSMAALTNVLCKGGDCSPFPSTKANATEDPKAWRWRGIDYRSKLSLFRIAGG